MTPLADSDDIPTDLGSTPRHTPSPSQSFPSSSIPLCSFDNKTLNQEADKQILAWATKLELETVELRDKSETLINIFTKKRGELTACIDRLETTLQTQFNKLTAEQKKKDSTGDSKINGMFLSLRSD